MGSMLQSVRTGRQRAAMRAILYGPEGVGKTSFAANAPRPIFLGAEKGTRELDVARVEPGNWTAAKALVMELTNDKHDFGTFVADTVDWLEPLVWRYVADQRGKADIEAFGYSKGYIYAADEWRVFLNLLDTMMARRGMHVLLLAHSRVKTFKNPEGADFDRYALAIHEDSAAVLRQWADAQFFANFDVAVKGEAKKGPRKGVGGTLRKLFAERSAAWDAKNRYGIPRQVPFDFAEVWRYYSRADEGTIVQALRVDLDKRIGEATRILSKPVIDSARNGLARAGHNRTQLAQLENWLETKLELAQLPTDEDGPASAPAAPATHEAPVAADAPQAAPAGLPPNPTPPPAPPPAPTAEPAEVTRERETAAATFATWPGSEIGAASGVAAALGMAGWKAPIGLEHTMALCLAACGRLGVSPKHEAIVSASKDAGIATWRASVTTEQAARFVALVEERCAHDPHVSEPAEPAAPADATFDPDANDANEDAPASMGAQLAEAEAQRDGRPA